MTAIIGGYLSLKTDAVKRHGARSAHTSAVARPLDGASLEALNWMQKTRWTVNKGVLATLEDCVKDGKGIGSLPAMENTPFPPQVSDDEFATMDKDTKSAYMAKRGAIYSHNKGLEGERFQLMRVLDMGQQLATQPVLWFPHTADFRGRFYPTAQDLHTQGDSLLKGLITFAEGERLGRSGERWLYVAMANAMGQDKITLDARADWTANNLTNIIATAQDPLGMSEFWGNADSPWEALALALEIGKLCDFRVANGYGSETMFESCIPVRLDATCSGIQHLSAMMKDELSAAAVNVLPTPGVRADIYSDVARVAIERVAMDAVGPDEDKRLIAQKWLGKIERKTVKRAVMTTPYGVTAPGIKNQLIADGFCSHFENGAERYRAAEYLKDVVVSSLDAKIGAPKAAMNYFQEVAQSLAERELPLIWTTPSGFTVRQAYVKSDLKRVNTLLGEKRINFQTAVPDEKGGIDRRKQKSSAAPNVVHSYDAAHLALTCVAMKREGVRDMAFVHDSFGTTAGQTDKLTHHIRNEFVKMYGGDSLNQWRESVMAHAGVTDIPALPTIGNLDVNRVMDSEFFFS
jgi:DNA-directed RNA polymerase